MAESFFLTDDEIQPLLEVCNVYKGEREYYGVDWSRLDINMNKYKKNLFSNILKIKPSLTVKRSGGKLKTIRTNFKKAVDTNKRSGGGRVVLTF